MSGIDTHTLFILHNGKMEDDSSFARNITNNGVIVSDKKSKFGNPTFYFNGSGTLSVDVPTGDDFTLEYWVNLDRFSQYTTPASWLQPNGSRGLYWHFVSGNSTLAYGNALAVNAAITTNEWHHVAACKRGTILYNFLDGALLNMLSVAQNVNLNQLVIGALVTSGETSTRMVGYIDELRVSNKARWTKPFTPPQVPYTKNKTVSIPFDSKSQTTFHARVYPINHKKSAQSELESQTNSLKVWMNKGVPIKELPVGTEVNMEFDGINRYRCFYVAKHDYESELNGTGRTLLVSKYAEGNQPWNSTNVNTYANSALDIRLDRRLYSAIPPYVKRKILPTKIRYTVGNGDNKELTMERKIFELSGAEMGFHVGNMNNEGSDLPIASMLKPATLANGQACNSHLRSPTTNSNATVWRLESNGSLYYPSATGNAADRPAFTISGDTLFVKDSGGGYTLLKSEV